MSCVHSSLSGSACTGLQALCWRQLGKHSPHQLMNALGQQGWRLRTAQMSQLAVACTCLRPAKQTVWTSKTIQLMSSSACLQCAGSASWDSLRFTAHIRPHTFKASQRCRLRHPMSTDCLQAKRAQGLQGQLWRRAPSRACGCFLPESLSGSCCLRLGS